MKIHLVFILLILTILCTLHCGKQDETYTVEIVGGVRHVHNLSPAWGDELRVGLEFVQRIGGIDVVDENYMLHQPRDVAIDSDGNIYVLDAGNFRIQKYSPEGNYLDTYGRRGQGPGEFENPVSIDIDSDGNISVADQGNNRVIVLSPEGRELRTFKFGSTVTPFRFLNSGEIVTGIITCGIVIRPIQQYNSIRKSAVFIFNVEGELIKTFCEQHDFEDNYTNTVGNSIYFALSNNDNIFLTFAYQNRIEKYTADGECIFSADRPLNFEIDVTQRSELRISPDGSVYVQLPEMKFVSTSIGVDYNDRVWVMTYRKQRVLDDPEPYLELEIYDNNGILLGEFPWTEDFNPDVNSFHMFGDRVFFRDEEGVSIYEYRIVEK